MPKCPMRRADLVVTLVLLHTALAKSRCPAFLNQSYYTAAFCECKYASIGDNIVVLLVVHRLALLI